MFSITKGNDGDGDTETSPDAGPKTKTNHNLTIVYIDHNLDKPTAKPKDDEAGKNTDRPSLAVVYIDHHLDGSVPSDTSQGSGGSNLFAAQGAVIQSQQKLFRLPPELRLMIWELLLPGKRLLQARAWYGPDRTIGPDNGASKIKGRQGKWYFRVYDWDIRDWAYSRKCLKIPNVLTICRESRNVALRHGSFIFGQLDKSHETGTWWNPDLDVLGFDETWDLDQHQWALAHLHGLEHVKRVAIDERQAWTVCYQAGYNGSYPLDIPRKLREPLAISFAFRGNDDRNHYILEFFPHFQQLKIIFSTIHDEKYTQMILRDWETVYRDFIDEDEYSVTFDMGSDIQTAVRELRRYRKLCMKTRVREPENDPYDALVDGPVYSVKGDGVDLDHLEHWMVTGFGMCQSDHDVPI